MPDENRLALGIDTGGTFTDAALLGVQSGQVTAAAKALTTYGQLDAGISNAVDKLPSFDPTAVELVSMSTTLATNAIVEGRGRPCALILIGYDEELVRNRGFMDELGTDQVYFVRGGHDAHGDEREPLDENALCEIAGKTAGKISALAVSSYFSVRNPSHELQAKALLEQRTELPVTCGHDLSSRLNSIRRATTAALNARLIPLLRELIQAVRGAMANRGIAAPLMVVKGDGSLVAAEVAMDKPVETILSGPAASAVGGHYLAQRDESIVVDMGGTTTDIAVLRGGRPRLNPEGARVGRWQTMVEAVDMRTVGLGGDSHVRINREGQLVIGPQRVIALSRLAAADPRILEAMRAQLRAKHIHQQAGVFVYPNSSLPLDLPEPFMGLQQGPQAWASILLASGYPYAVRRQLAELVAHGWVTLAGFTPTDALHVTGDLALWSAEASTLGAELLARRVGTTSDAVAQTVVNQVSERAAREIVAKAVNDALGDISWPGDAIAEYLVTQGLDHHTDDPLIAYQLQVKRPLVAIGAPVEAYFPQVAEHLHGELLIPSYAEVANAVGAVAGSIIQRIKIKIRPLEDGSFRLHGPEEVRDFLELEQAVEHAHAQGTALAEQHALEAGAHRIEVQVERNDQIVTAANRLEEIYLGTDLLITAVGRVIMGLA